MTTEQTTESQTFDNQLILDEIVTLNQNIENFSILSDENDALIDSKLDLIIDDLTNINIKLDALNHLETIDTTLQQVNNNTTDHFDFMEDFGIVLITVILVSFAVNILSRELFKW